MSRAEVIRLISAIITIVDATIQVSNAVKDQSGLPPNFKAAATTLHLIPKLLNGVERYVENTKEESNVSNFEIVLADCEKKATQLQRLFETVVLAESDSRMRRYLKAARTIGKGGRVKELMAGLHIDIQMMATISYMS